jgi:RNA polymerase sigma factor (sigma-70 family)
MIASAAIVTPLTSSAAAAGMDRAASRAPDQAVRHLTSGLAAGDEEAFRQFHAAYFDRLLRYLFVATHGDEEAAHDALQETMMRVVRYARRFDSEQVFWGWLTVLARSAVIDAGRKRQRYWRLIKEYALFWIGRRADAPDEHDSEGYLLSALQDSLHILSPVDRQLIEGKYLSGASMRDLGAQFQLTERAVESRLLRARRQLRVELLNKLKNEKGI